jgi:hypothetical protein
VAEGDRIGSVEHPIHASLSAVSGISLSDLMVGGPVDSSELLRPTVGYIVSYGSLHGYLEAYGSGLVRVAATYEVAASADGPTLLTADVPHRDAGGDRKLFTKVLPVSKLPPGEYVLRARLTAGGAPLKTLSRRFEIAPPAVLMTSAAGTGAAPPAAGTVDLFLPVDEGTLMRPFAREDALRAQALDPFLERVPATSKPAFELGLAELRKANYSGAITQFKSAIRPDVDSTAALTYLGASLAAGGAPAEAANVWQTALVDGSDLPQIYEWHGGAMDSRGSHRPVAIGHPLLARSRLLVRDPRAGPRSHPRARSLYLGRARRSRSAVPGDGVDVSDPLQPRGRRQPVGRSGAGPQLRRAVRQVQRHETGARRAVAGLSGEREAVDGFAD